MNKNDDDDASSNSTEKSPDIPIELPEAFKDMPSDEKEKLKKMTMNTKERRDEIDKKGREIKADIKDLENTIQDILDKHHKDYISSFSAFMDKVRKDLKLKLEQMEKIEEEKSKIHDVKLVKCERDYFRAEAIRLSKMTKELKNKIDDLTRKNKMLIKEVSELNIKWKDSESVNKQLLLELENYMKSPKENEINNFEQNNNNNILINVENINNNKLAMLNNSASHSTMEEDDRKKQEIALINDQMRRLRNELKKERERSHMALGELNKIYLERNKLENIFIDCVEETRKIIFNRKLKENNGGYKIKQRIGCGKYDYRMNLTTKYESFLPSDKQSILENFVFNDEVSNIIRDAIFTRPKKEKEKFENTKNIIKNLSLYEQNKKRNVSSDGKKPDSAFLSDQKELENIKNEMKDKAPRFAATGSKFFKAGRMTMLNFNDNQYGHSSKLTVPMQIS